jgi:hypothetical protein
MQRYCNLITSFTYILINKCENGKIDSSIIAQESINFCKNIAFHLHKFDMEEKNDGFLHIKTGLFFNKDGIVIKKISENKEMDLTEEDKLLCKCNNWKIL